MDREESRSLYIKSLIQKIKEAKDLDDEGFEFKRLLELLYDAIADKKKTYESPGQD